MVDTTRLSGITKASGKKTSAQTKADNAKLNASAKAFGEGKKSGIAQSKAEKKATAVPLSTFGSQTKPVAKPVNTNTISGIRDASKTGSSGVKSSPKAIQQSKMNSDAKAFGEGKIQGIESSYASPRVVSGGGKKGTGKMGGTYTSTGSVVTPKTTPTTPTTSTTKPVSKPITTTAAPAPKPTPSVPGKTTGSGGTSATPSGSLSSTGTPIRIATSNLFVLNEPEQEIEQMANLIIQDIGGIELLSYSRNDLIAEQEINYQPIKNIADTSLQYNPLSILAIQDIDLDYFNKFPISLERHLPRFGNGPNQEYVYINTDNEVVVEAVNLLPGQYIEIQFLSFGSTVSDTIYT